MRKILLVASLLFSFNAFCYGQDAFDVSRYSHNGPFRADAGFHDTWSEADVGAGRWDEGHVSVLHFDLGLAAPELQGIHGYNETAKNLFWLDMLLFEMLLEDIVDVGDEPEAYRVELRDISNGV